MNDKLKLKIARLLPRDIAYWAAIRIGAHATTGQFGSQEVPALLFVDALKRWNEPHVPPQPSIGTKLKKAVTCLFQRKAMFKLVRGALALQVDATAHAALPEPQRALYVADGTGFKLDVTGIEDPAPLKNALAAERKAAKDAVTRAKALEDAAKVFEGIDPVKYREMMSKIGDGEEAALIAAGKIDEVVTRRTVKLQADFEKKLKEASTKADGAMEVATTYMDRVLDNHVRAAATKAGLHASAVDDALLRARSMFTLDDDGNPVQYDKDGTTVIMGKDGKNPFSPAEWLDGMKETAPHWFPNNGSGGGAGGSKGAEGKNTITRSQFDAKMPHEKAAYVKAGGKVVD